MSSVLRPNDLSFTDDGDFNGAVFGTVTTNAVGTGGETNATIVLGTEATDQDTEENSTLLAIESVNGFSLVDDAGNTNDDLEAQSQASFTDGAAPQITDIAYQDAVGAEDGLIDQVTLTFSEELNAASNIERNDLLLTEGDFTSAEFGTNTTNLVAGGESSLIVTFGTASTVLDTEDNSGAFRLTTQNTFSLSDGVNVNTRNDNQPQASITDNAAPVITSITYEDSEPNGTIDQLTLEFSEDLVAATNLSLNDLTFTDVGDFADAEFGTSTANLISGGETSLTLSLGTASTAEDTRDDSGDLEISSINGFSLVDGSGNTNADLESQAQATYVDGAAPYIATAIYRDTDAIQDAVVDEIEITFTEDLGSATYESNDWSLSAYTIDAGAISGSVLTLDISGTPVDDTALPSFTVSYTNGTTADDITDPDANHTADISNFAVEDGAAPVITAITYQDADGSGTIDQVTLDFSETLGAASVLSRSDLLISDVGDFTSAAFGTGSNLLGLGTETSIVVTFGTESSVQDTEDDASGGTFEITSQASFSLTDGTTVNNRLGAQSQATVVDGAAPVITDFEYEDSDIDGRIDQFVVTFSEDLAMSSVLRPNDLSFTDDGDFNGAVFGTVTTNAVGTGGETNATIVLGTEATDQDTEENSTLLAIESVNGFSLVDDAGNTNDDLEAQSQASFTDGAAPQITDIAYQDAVGAEDGLIDQVTLTFSEELNAASNIERNDLLLTEGDFTSAEFGTNTTNLVAGGESSLIVTFGTASTVLDTEDNSGAFRLTTQNTFSLSDGVNVNTRNDNQPQASITDNAAPVITSITYEDSEPDGMIDQFTFEFSEDLSNSTNLSLNDLSFTDVGDFTDAAFGASMSNLISGGETDLTFSIGTESTAEDTRDDSGDLEISSVNGFSLVDDAGNINSDLESQSQATYNDGAAPYIATAIYRDTDVVQDAVVDAVEITFTEDLGSASYEAADWSLSAYTIDAGAIAGSVLTLDISGTPDDDTSLPTFTVSYTNGNATADDITDPDANHTADITGFTVEDGAAPVITAITYQDADGSGTIDQVTLDFSETLGAASVLSRSDLLISDAGDFTSAAFGSGSNLLGLGTETSIVVTFGTEASVQDTEDDVSGGTFEITSQASFSLTDGTTVNNRLGAQSQATVIDGAAPVITDFQYLDVDFDGNIDQIIASFSEDLGATSILRPADLTFSNVGDFTGAAFGTSTTNTVGAGGETAATITLGTEATADDTNDSGLIAISSQGSFSLVDNATSPNTNSDLEAQTQATFTDGAAPSITEVTFYDNDSDDGLIDEIDLVFTENISAVTAATFTGGTVSLTLPDGETATFSSSNGDYTVSANVLTVDGITGQVTPATDADGTDNDGFNSIALSGLTNEFTDGTNTTSDPDNDFENDNGFVDMAAPVVSDVEFYDNGQDGIVDEVRIVWSEPTSVNATGGSVFDSGEIISLVMNEGTDVTASLGAFTYDDQDAGSGSEEYIIEDITGVGIGFSTANPGALFAIDIQNTHFVDQFGNSSTNPDDNESYVDKAAPVFIAAHYYDVNPVDNDTDATDIAQDGNIDEIVLEMSETVDETTLVTGDFLLTSGTVDAIETVAYTGPTGSDNGYSNPLDADNDEYVTLRVSLTGTAPTNLSYTDGGNFEDDFENVVLDNAGIAIVDAAAPVITSVTTGTVAGIYGIPQTNTSDGGTPIDITLNLSENVTVNTTGGTPRVTLNTVTVATVDLASSGTNTLTFQYEVSAGEAVSDLNVDDFDLNGGSVADGSNNLIENLNAANDLDANLIDDGSVIEIDGVLPAISNVHFYDTDFNGVIDEIVIEVNEQISESILSSNNIANAFSVADADDSDNSIFFVTNASASNDLDNANDQYFTLGITNYDNGTAYAEVTYDEVGDGSGPYRLQDLVTNIAASPLTVDDEDFGVADADGDDLVDAARPVIVASVTLDTDDDGDIDRFEIELSEAIEDSEFSETGAVGDFELVAPTSTTTPNVFGTSQVMTGGFSNSVTDVGGLGDQTTTDVSGAGADDQFFSFDFTPTTINGTGVFVLEYEEGTNSNEVEDAAGNVLLIPSAAKSSDVTGTTELFDYAAPLIKGITGTTDNSGAGTLAPADESTGIGAITSITVDFTELVFFDGSNSIFFVEDDAPPTTTQYNVSNNFADVLDEVDNGEVTITVPTTGPGLRFYTTIEAAAFADAAGNTSAEQLDDSNDWNFVTANAVNVSSTSFDNINNDDFSIQLNTDVSITVTTPTDFSEFTIEDGKGTVFNPTAVSLTNSDNDINIEVDFSTAVGDLLIDYAGPGSNRTFTADFGGPTDDLDAFTDLVVDLDDDAPTLSSADRTDIGGGVFVVDLDFDEEIQLLNAVLAEGDFVVTDDANVTYTIDELTEPVDNRIRMSFTTSIATISGNLTIDYTNGANIEDFGSNQLASFSTEIVLDTDAPSLASVAIIDDNTLELTFSEPVSLITDSPASDFTVEDTNGDNYVVSTIYEDGTANDAVLLLDLSPITDAFLDLTIEYSITSSSITDLAGNDLPTFSGVTDQFVFDANLNPVPSFDEQALSTASDPADQIDNAEALALFRTDDDNEASVVTATPIEIQPSIDGSTITIYSDAGLGAADVVYQETVTGTTPIYPTMQQLFEDDASTTADDGEYLADFDDSDSPDGTDDGVFTFYITETSPISYTNGAEGEALEYTIAILDDVTLSGLTNLQESDDPVTMTIADNSFLSSFDVVYAGSGVIDDASAVTGTFYPSISGEGTQLVNLTLSSNTTGKTATFDAFSFVVTGDITVFNTSADTEFGVSEGTITLDINSSPDETDIGSANTSDRDFIDIETYFLDGSGSIITTATASGSGTVETGVLSNGELDIITYTGSDVTGALEVDGVWDIDLSLIQPDTISDLRQLRIAMVVDDPTTGISVLTTQDVNIYPDPVVSGLNLEESYCEDNVSVNLTGQLFTFSGDIEDQTITFSNGYSLAKDNDYDGTYETAVGTGTFTDETLDIQNLVALYDTGSYQLTYVTTTQTPADLTGTVVQNFEIASRPPAPLLTDATLQGVGGLGTGNSSVATFSGTDVESDAYFLEYTVGDTILSLFAQLDSASWSDVDGNTINADSLDADEIYFERTVRTTDLNYYAARIDTVFEDTEPLVCTSIFREIQIVSNDVPDVPAVDTDDLDTKQATTGAYTLDNDANTLTLEYCVGEAPDDLEFTNTVANGTDHFIIIPESKSIADTVYLNASTFSWADIGIASSADYRGDTTVYMVYVQFDRVFETGDGDAYAGAISDTLTITLDYPVVSVDIDPYLADGYCEDNGAISLSADLIVDNSIINTLSTADGTFDILQSSDDGATYDPLASDLSSLVPSDYGEGQYQINFESDPITDARCVVDTLINFELLGLPDAPELTAASLAGIGVLGSANSSVTDFNGVAVESNAYMLEYTVGASISALFSAADSSQWEDVDGNVYNADFLAADQIYFDGIVRTDDPNFYFLQVDSVHFTLSPSDSLQCSSIYREIQVVSNNVPDVPAVDTDDLDTKQATTGAYTLDNDANTLTLEYCVGEAPDDLEFTNTVANGTDHFIIIPESKSIADTVYLNASTFSWADIGIASSADYRGDTTVYMVYVQFDRVFETGDGDAYAGAISDTLTITLDYPVVSVDIDPYLADGYCEDNGAISLSADLIVDNSIINTLSTADGTFDILQSSDDGATYDPLASDLSSLVPSDYGEGQYQINFESDPITDARCVVDTLINFELLGLPDAPELTAASLAGIGVLGSANSSVTDFNGVAVESNAYMLEYTVGASISALFSAADSSQWEDVDGNVYNADFLAADQIYFDGIVRTDDPNFYFLQVDSVHFTLSPSDSLQCSSIYREIQVVSNNVPDLPRVDTDELDNSQLTTGNYIVDDATNTLTLEYCVGEAPHDILFTNDVSNIADHFVVIPASKVASDTVNLNGSATLDLDNLGFTSINDYQGTDTVYVVYLQNNRVFEGTGLYEGTVSDTLTIILDYPEIALDLDAYVAIGYCDDNEAIDLTSDLIVDNITVDQLDVNDFDLFLSNDAGTTYTTSIATGLTSLDPSSIDPGLYQIRYDEVVTDARCLVDTVANFEVVSLPDPPQLTVATLLGVGGLGTNNSSVTTFNGVDVDEDAYFLEYTVGDAISTLFSTVDSARWEDIDGNIYDTDSLDADEIYFDRIVRTADPNYYFFQIDSVGLTLTTDSLLCSSIYREVQIVSNSVPDVPSLNTTRLDGDQSVTGTYTLDNGANTLLLEYCVGDAPDNLEFTNDISDINDHFMVISEDLGDTLDISTTSSILDWSALGFTSTDDYQGDTTIYIAYVQRDSVFSGGTDAQYTGAVSESLTITLDYPVVELSLIPYVAAEYCEDDEAIDLSSDLSVDGSVVETLTVNNYDVWQSTDGSTYNPIANDTRLSSFDPTTYGDGFFRIVYDSTVTDARCLTSTSIDFELINTEAAPVLMIGTETELDSAGGYDSGSDRYVFEFAQGDPIPNLDVIDIGSENYFWYESLTDLVNGEILTGATSLDVGLIFNGSNTPASGESDIYLTQQVRGCESENVEIALRVIDAPTEPLFDEPLDNININEDRGEYFFEYCGPESATIPIDMLDFTSDLEDSEFGDIVEARSFFVAYSADTVAIDTVFYNDMPYQFDLVNDLMGDNTTSPNANNAITTTFYVSKVIADSTFNHPLDTAIVFGGIESELTPVTLAVYTNPDRPATIAFTGEPQLDEVGTSSEDFNEDEAIIHYYVCRTDSVGFPDVGVNAPAGDDIPNTLLDFKFEWYTEYDEDNDVLSDSIITDNQRGEVVSFNDLRRHMTDASGRFTVLEAGTWTYYVRLVSNINEDSDYPGCEGPVRQVNVTVFPDVLQASLAVQLDSESPDQVEISDPTTVFDYVYNFCVEAGRGLSPNTVFDATVDATSEFGEVLRWFPVDAGGNVISSTASATTDASTGHDVTATDLRIAGVENEVNRFGLIYNKEFEPNGFEGCFNIDTTFVEINVNTVPEFSFSWEGITQDSVTVFNFYDSLLITTGTGTTIRDDGLVLTITDSDDMVVDTHESNDVSEEFSTRFGAAGVYGLELSVTSDAGCNQTLDPRNIRVLSRVELDLTGTTITFNDSDEGWFAEYRSDDGTLGSYDGEFGRINSWVWGVPDGIEDNIDGAANGDGNAWSTTGSNDTGNGGTYSGQEVSFIYSPSYDFDAFTNPAVEFISYIDIESGLRDGVVLQYSTDNGRRWTNVGSYDFANDLSSGENWYEDTNITSNPGNITLDGDETGFNTGGDGWAALDVTPDQWSVSRNALDGIAGNRDVRFRFALSASGAQEDVKANDGFAFDNIRFFELEKTVLLEQFSSVISDVSVQYDTTLTRRDEGNERLIDTDNETLLITYFTSLANNGNNQDTLNLRNPSGPGARRAYYGIDVAPTSVIDGEIQQPVLDNGRVTSALSFSEGDLSLARLEPADFIIRPTVEATNGGTTISASAEFEYNRDEASDLDLSFVFAIVEDIPLGPGEQIGLYTEGDTIFNALRILQPSPAGYTFQGRVGAVDIDTVFDYSIEWEINNVYDPQRLQVIAFVQDNNLNEDGFKPVLQAASLNVVGAVAEVPLSIDGVSDFSVYPNPADKEVTVQFEAPLGVEANWYLYDQAGREVVYGRLEKGMEGLKIDTEDVPSGLYFFYLTSLDEEQKARAERIIIVH